MSIKLSNTPESYTANTNLKVFKIMRDCGIEEGKAITLIDAIERSGILFREMNANTVSQPAIRASEEQRKYLHRDGQTSSPDAG